MRIGLVLLLSLGFAFAGAARADSDEGQTPEQQARAAAKRGDVHYRLRRFGAAAEAYQIAYDKHPVPALLFNIGQCHFALEEYEQAAFFYRRFLSDAPNAANREIAEQRLQEAEARAEEERKRKAAEEALRAAEVERERLALEIRLAEEERERLLAQKALTAEERARLEALERVLVEQQRLKAPTDLPPREEAPPEDGAVWLLGGAAIGGTAVAVALVTTVLVVALAPRGPSLGVVNWEASP